MTIIPFSSPEFGQLLKETVVCHSDGHTTVSRTPKVTGRGQQYFIERFLDGRLTPDLADDEGAAA